MVGRQDVLNCERGHSENEQKAWLEGVGVQVCGEGRKLHYNNKNYHRPKSLRKAVNSHYAKAKSLQTQASS